jgi:preprotein translocase subunit SecE
MAMLGRKEPATQQTPGAPAPAPRKTTSAAAPEKPSRMAKLQEQLRNVRVELEKVTWPTRDETRNLTIVVIGLTGAVGTALFMLDSLLSFLYRLPR